MFPTSRALLAGLGLALVGGAPSVAHADNDPVHFSRGSLIIPEEGVYQTACGTISAYGLVWRILQSNSTGHYNANHPVTVYWVINGTKTSPNRCVPNNRVGAPTPNVAGTSGDVNHWDDPAWNDGCDAAVTNNTEQPVVPVTFSSTWPVGGVFGDAAVPMYTTSAAYALPAFTATTLDNAVTSPRFKTIQYMGGPFVIDAADAKNVWDFLKNGDTAGGVPLGTGQTGAISRFTDTGCTCSGTDPGPTTACHTVNIHQSTIDFTANVNKRINQLPPKIALLNAGTGVSTGILDDYLDNAGLLVTGTGGHDTAGCPNGTFSGCSLNGSTALVQNSGTIYDEFSANEDLISTASNPHGLLNALDAYGRLKYRVFWTPHWEATTSSFTEYVDNGDGAAGDQRVNTLNNIAYFANQKGTGLMAECASLESYEGSYKATVAAQCNTGGVCKGYTSYCNQNADCPSAGTCATKVCNSGNAGHAGKGCSKNSNCGTGGLCNVTVTTTICDSGTNARLVCASNADCPGSTPSGVAIPVYTTSTNFQFSNTIEINGLSTTAWDGRNCTDPNYLALTGTRPACTVYPNPGDPFSQVGDFHYAGTGGHVHNYRPNRAATPVSAYKSGVKRLAVAWDNYQSGQYPSTQPDTDDGWDFFSLAQKDNDPAKATVVYLAGHTYATTVTGNRIVLNTLLNLGADPISSDRALAAPVAFTDANGSDSNGTRAIVVTSTYSAVSGYPPNSDTYVQSAGSLWVFPYTPGHLRAHSLIGGDQLTVGQSNHDQHTLWDADGKMPLPADRNLFTYFGGDLATNPTLPGGGVAPHGILQMGWVPENVAGTSINGTYGGVPNPSCVDVLTYGGFHNKKKNTNTFGFVAGGDGVCDLQQATEFTALNPGADFGVSEHAANEAALLSDLPAVQQMLQHVRGYCFATSGHADGSGTPILQPTDGQCNAQNFNGDNRAHIGGLAHSSPAVIPPSTNVVDSGALRPTVAYVAGLDGQLHAFYVSGGSGYTGPSGSVTYVNTQASSKFVTDWASKFAAANLPAPGTELWSFLPPSQLPLLKGNSARVDSTPVVQDVFIDPGGKGVREWHTVLVISTGNTGRELFAMDITNPLKPALMWDLMGSLAQTTGTPAYSTLALANDPTTGAAFSFKWDESAANFVLPPGTDPGRTASGLYDYSDLGGASGLTIAQLRAGLEPVYAVFATSNASGVNTQSKALEAFGIDVATGQKLWQWEQPYSAAWADNTVPVVGTVLGGTDGANRLLVGDMEGRVWDLSAMTGANLQTFTGITGCTGACKFALFDTQSTNVSPQPITTNISIAKIPNPATAGSLLVPYQGSNVLLFGTAGADWVASSVVGNMHLVLLDDQYKVPFRSGGTHLDATAFLQPAALSAAQTSGVLQEPSGFPIALAAGEHLYGNLTVAGQTVYFESAKGSVNDLMTLSATTAGATYSIDLGAATTGARYSPLTGFALANFGGVAVFHNQDTMTTSTDYVIGSEVSQMALLKISNSTATGASSPNVQLAPPGTATNASRFLGWVRRVLK